MKARKIKRQNEKDCKLLTTCGCESKIAHETQFLKQPFIYFYSQSVQ